MGLHSPSTYEGLSADNRQERQQLWFGVLNQDRHAVSKAIIACLADRYQVSRTRTWAALFGSTTALAYQDSVPCRALVR